MRVLHGLLLVFIYVLVVSFFFHRGLRSTATFIQTSHAALPKN